MPEEAALELRKFAAEVRCLAYELPAGVGEHTLLQLSQRMHSEADRWLRRSPMARTTCPPWD
jgi:hypothetical protein